MKNFKQAMCIYLFVIFQLCITTVSFADNTLELEAEADTLIRTDLNLRRNDNYGCQQLITVGTSRGGGSIPFGGADAMRSLVRFDLSSVALPIVNATLEMTVFGFDNGASSSDYNVETHRILDSGILTPWIEGNGLEGGVIPTGCTNTEAAFGVAWVGAGNGGDANNQTQPSFATIAESVVSINQGSTATGDVFQWDLTELVIDWLSGAHPNHGIMLIDPTSDGAFRGIRFGAREGLLLDDFDEAVAGPRLVIELSIEVGIDIKPGSYPNSMNLSSGGATPVAILGSEDFDVIDIDPETVNLGTAGVKTVGKQDRLLCNIDDVSGDFDLSLEGNPDGFLDLVCHIITNNIEPEQGNTTAKLNGVLYDGTPIVGSDSVNIVPK